MRHVSSRPDPERPWYRHGLVWLVIALPAASVVGGLATLAIAITHADATVADHWYQDGKAINRSLEEERRAEFLGLGWKSTGPGVSGCAAKPPCPGRTSWTSPCAIRCSPSATGSCA